MFRTRFLVAAIILGVVTVHATDVDSYKHSIEQWHAGRVQRLTAPDGWLSLIGLEWLKPGANRVGSAADNDIVLKAGPAHLGVVTLAADGKVQITLAADSGALVDGKPAQHATLIDDAHAGDATPTTVSFGSASFHVIDRDGRKGLRVKDTDSPGRKHFVGIESFPIDPSWRIEATWVPAKPGETLEMGSVIGTIDKYPVPGKLEFTRDGKHFEILPGGILSKGIMRSYARTVGIDEAAWVERFLDASREHGVAENENGWTEFVQNVGRSRARRRHRGEWLRRFTGVGLFVLILASFGWLVWQYVSARALAETTAPHSISSTVATSPNGNPTTQ